MSSAPVQRDSPLVAGLSIGETASRLGVSASTLRSWDRRYGLGPSGRSGGGHRRYTLRDVARLQQVRRFVEGGMSTADAVAASLASTPPVPRVAPGRQRAPLRRFQQFADDRVINRLVVAADALDSPGIARATQALLHERGTIRTWTSVLLPLLQQIGGYWQREQDGVECEHLIADALQAVLLTYSWSRRQHRAAKPADAVLAATPAEGHTLPLYAVAAALAERGLCARVLGSVPPASLLTAVDQLAPTALVLWARTHDATDAALLAGLRGRVPLLCAAGDWGADAPSGCVTTTDLTTTVQALADWIRPTTGGSAHAPR